MPCAVRIASRLGLYQRGHDDASTECSKSEGFYGLFAAVRQDLSWSSHSDETVKAETKKRRHRRLFRISLKQIRTPLQLSLRLALREHPFGLGNAQSHPVSRSAIAGQMLRRQGGLCQCQRHILQHKDHGKSAKHLTPRCLLRKPGEGGSLFNQLHSNALSIKDL